jgi:GNAT superfamily N-acetyltransferase
VRRAARADAGELVQFQVKMAKETESLDLDLGVITPGVEHLFEDPGKGEYFVVCEEEGAGEILGSLMVTYEWSDWRNGLVWWIQSVYVRPEFRGQGLFKALYAFVKHDCKARGAIGLRLYADQDNARAIEVYKRLGMTSHYLVFEDMWNE